jgi:hypothetical protein
VAGFTGMGGSFRMEWVAGFERNQWQAWTGIRNEAKQRALGRTSSYEDKMGAPVNLSADDYLKNDHAANPDYPFSLDDDETEH